MSTITTDILIIGAGLAGLSAANDLQQAGHQVLVIDKGRGLGGRLAGRRIGEPTCLITIVFAIELFLMLLRFHVPAPASRYAAEHLLLFFHDAEQPYVGLTPETGHPLLHVSCCKGFVTL